MKDYKEASRIRREMSQSIRDQNGVTVGLRYPTYQEIEPILKERQREYGLGPEYQDKFEKYQRAIMEKMEAESMKRLIGLATNTASIGAAAALTSPSSVAIDNRMYTTGSSSPPPRKPTKQQLLSMLAEIEKTEPKPAMLELNQERVIDL